MASAWYNRSARRVPEGTTVLTGLKLMLVTSVYVFNRDHDFVDAGGASDPLDAELSGSGYVGGLGGAGRKSLASLVWSEDDANDRGELDFADVVWAAINAGTAAAAIVIKEGGADTSTELIAYVDGGMPVVTNGGDVTLVMPAEGLLHFMTT